MSIWQDDQTANNTTTGPQQENPNDVGEDGDSQAVEEWLSGRLTEQLGDSAIQISQGQYEEGESLLGDEYQETLSKYVEVAGETNNKTAEQQREQFNETAQTQSEYAATLAEYQTTYDEYQAARENGNTERARRLARELRTLAEKLGTLTNSLTTDYQNVSETTGSSFEAETAAVQNTTRNVTQQTQAVVTDVFTPTTITATATRSGSFTSPIRITGNVTTNGTAPLNGSVQMEAPEQVVASQVSADGSFTLRYRPTEAPTGRLVENVTYVPAPNGTYLGANATIQANVTQSTPSLTLTEHTSALQFSTTIRASGRVTAGGTSVPNTAVQVSVGNDTLGEVKTNASGYYTFDTTVPATISTGTHELRVQVGSPDTALAPVSTTESVGVQETETTVTLTTTRVGEEVQIRGRLQTADGTGIGSQSVALKHGDSAITAVESNASGYFQTRIPLPEDTENETVALQAVFEGGDTNLATARTTATVQLPQDGGLFGSGIPLLPAVLGSVALVGLAGGGYAFLRTRSPADDSVSESPTDGPSSPTGGSSHPAADWRGGVEQRLEQVPEYLEAGNVEAAVRTLYGVTRTTYAKSDHEHQTHWEFFNTVRDDLSADASTMLRELTETYEAVQFAEEDPSTGHVNELLTGVKAQFDEEEENRNPH